MTHPNSKTITTKPKLPATLFPADPKAHMTPAFEAFVYRVLELRQVSI